MDTAIGTVARDRPDGQTVGSLLVYFPPSPLSLPPERPRHRGCLGCYVRAVGANADCVNTALGLTLNFEHDLKRMKVRLMSVVNTIDTNTPEGRLQF